jgi:nicotinamide riboside kinase
LAVIGAECSGKSTLAHQLGAALPATVVPEYLRSFVERHRRVPTADEQGAVMAGQIAAEASARGRWVVSDSGALMTAVYSILYYDDDRLVHAAVEHHRHAYRTTVWCDIDLPWTADEGQRDGPQYRTRGHQIIAEIVSAHSLPVLAVSGSPSTRLTAVLKELADGR